MKLVTLREADSGRVFQYDGDSVAMQLPDTWPDDAVVTVSGDVVERSHSGGETETYRSTTRRVAQFFSDERCLIPSDRVSAEGRTLWRVVEVVEAVHLGTPPTDG